jgi:hypothetical protein
MLIVTGCFYLGFSIDFIVILLTGNNVLFSDATLFFVSFIWAPLSGGIGLYITTGLLVPKLKWYIRSIFLILLLVLYSIVFLDPAGNLHTSLPSTPGEDLIEHEVIYGSPANILIIIMASLTLGFGTFGTLIKGARSKDIIRKKLFSLSIFYKFGMMISFWFFYFGLKEEPEKVKISAPETEIKIEDGLFRIRKRPSHITEEEVSISKEKKICLVCKGKLSGYNIFICPGCDTMYCTTCVRALESLENACWVCNDPINKSKPVKIGKKSNVEVDLEKFGKP